MFFCCPYLTFVCTITIISTISTITLISIISYKKGHTYYLGELSKGFHCHLLFKPTRDQNYNCGCMGSEHNHVPDNIAALITSAITASISNHVTARTYHMEVFTTQSEFLQNSRDATFPVSWLQRVAYQFHLHDLDQVGHPHEHLWFQHHDVQMLVNKHGQNLYSEDESLESTIKWLNPGISFL